MLTLVAAVDVYDLAAEGATDAFELLSSPRVSRYAISWTSVEKDIVATNLAVGSVFTVRPLKLHGRRLREQEKYPQMRFQIVRRLEFNRSRVLRRSVKGSSSRHYADRSVCGKGLGKLSIAVTFGFVGIGAQFVKFVKFVDYL
jgi:hypothetical protein